LKSGRTSAPRLPHSLQVNALLDIGQPDIIELGVATDGA
jgi:hypothetical protein